jgi:thymidine phosphorylase
VQHAAGILLHAKPGDRVSAGQPLLELHTDTPDAVPSVLAALREAVDITDGPGPTRPLILETVRP